MLSRRLLAKNFLGLEIKKKATMSLMICHKLPGLMAFSSSQDAIYKKSVVVAIANGSEEIETVSIVDVLRRAQDIRVTVAKVDKNEGDEKSLMNLMSRGVKVEADAHFNNALLSDCDAIILPGGLGGDKAFAASEPLVDSVKKFLDDD